MAAMVASIPLPAVLKVKCDEDVRRFILHEAPTHESVMQLIAEAWPEFFGEGAGRRSQVKYTDDEGDLCTLTLQTFADFLSLQAQTEPGKKPLLKLEALPVRPQAQATPADAPPGLPPPPPQPEPRLEPAAADEEEEEEEQEDGAWAGHGGCHFLPWRLTASLQALRESGVLTDPMLASLVAQWLPMLTQRVARKADKIGHMTRSGLSGTCRTLLEALEACCGRCAGLDRFRAPLREALAAEPGPENLGETLLGLLKALQAEPFAARVAFVGQAAEQLMHVLEQLEGPLHERPNWSADQFVARAVHPGVTCDSCGVSPILGPRFKCERCHDYDLCGNCYPHKEALHAEQGGAEHPFRCMLKGGKGGKGWCKGAHKGAFWAAMMAGPGFKHGADAAQQFAWHPQPEFQQGQEQPWPQPPWEQPSGFEGFGDWFKGCGKGPKGHKGWKGWRGFKGCKSSGKGSQADPLQHFMQHMATHFQQQQQHQQQHQQQQHQQQEEDLPQQQQDVPQPEHEQPGQLEPQKPPAHSEGEVAPVAEKAEASMETEDPAKEPEPEQSVEDKLAMLRAMGLGSDEVNRELLVANGGDCTKVAQLLTE